MKNKNALLCLGWLLAGLLYLGLPASAQISSLVVFGDSLSDTGNVYAATGGRIPLSPPYYNGRFSNGPVWIEHFAQRLGLSNSVRNFAYGGARTGPTPIPELVPTIQQQVGLFLGSTPAVDPNALYVVWGGFNDYNSGGVTDPNVSVNNIKGALSTLSARGARQFYVVNLFPPPGSNAALLVQHNALLSSALVSLGAQFPGTNFTLGDTIPFTSAILQNPGAYGFSNLTTPFLGSGGTDPDTYLWWDQFYHPTARLHGLFGNYAALSFVPEPGTVSLLAVSALGGIGLLLRRRGSRL